MQKDQRTRTNTQDPRPPRPENRNIRLPSRSMDNQKMENRREKRKQSILRSIQFHRSTHVIAPTKSQGEESQREARQARRKQGKTIDPADLSATYPSNTDPTALNALDKVASTPSQKPDQSATKKANPLSLDFGIPIQVRLPFTYSMHREKAMVGDDAAHHPGDTHYHKTQSHSEDTHPRQQKAAVLNRPRPLLSALPRIRTRQPEGQEPRSIESKGLKQSQPRLRPGGRCGHGIGGGASSSGSSGCSVS